MLQELRLQLLEHDRRPFLSLRLWVNGTPQQGISLRLEELGWLKSALESEQLVDAIFDHLGGPMRRPAATKKRQPRRKSPRRAVGGPDPAIRPDGTIADEDVFS